MYNRINPSKGRYSFMTKKKMAFVTDSTVCLTDELKNHPDVYIVPIVIISNGQELEDGIDLSSDELYSIIRNEKEVPKTSQPNVGKFIGLYEKLKDEYEGAIAIHVSSKLSGTLSSSSTAKEQVDFDVEIIDSYTLSHGITDLIEKGLKLSGQDMDRLEVAQKLREEAKHSRNLIVLGSLEQLYKGGRMSGVEFLLGNFLKIKPILSINTDGELGLLERIRSEKKALNRIIELVKQACEENSVSKLGIMHANAMERAKELRQKLQETVPNLETVIGDISSSLAVHAGEDSLAVFWSQGKL